jgi:hypothetical protein
MTEHQQKGKRLFRKVIRHLLLTRADYLISNGPSCTRYIHRYCYPPERIREIYTVSDIKRFSATIRRVEWNGLRRLLYVGRLVEGKGLLEFLEILDRVVAEMAEIKIEFAVVGYGPLEGRLREWRSACGQVCLRLLGYVDTSEHPEVYQEGDVFVFPTLSDEWGLVVNEAMAAGLPIFGSRYSQAVEVLVREGVHGFTFTSGTDDVAPQLKRLLGLRQKDIWRFGQQCREHISRLSVDRCANEFLAAIKSCLAMPKRSV